LAAVKENPEYEQANGETSHGEGSNDDEIHNNILQQPQRLDVFIEVPSYPFDWGFSIH
jgi:hypothetical protein